MTGDNISSSRISGIQSDAQRAQQAAESKSISRYAINQEVNAEPVQEGVDAAFNPINMARRFETLESRIKKKGKEEEADKTEQSDTEIVAIDKLEAVSEEFERKNPELHAKSLLLLRSRISSSDSADDILRKVLETYPDPSLADDALDFLFATSDGALAEKIVEVKEKFNENYGREIRAGKNIATHARAFSKEGLGSPTGLRDLYRDITGNPRDPTTLFNELTSQYSFEKMKTVIAFILHSLGGDLKSKGPSIDRGELHRLMTEARTLQAILGVYRFFRSRMALIFSAFEREGLTPNNRITFEMLSKLFVKLLAERYPSSDKIIQMGMQLGLSDEIIAEVIIFTQMRDAVRQVAPRLFRSEQHRFDILNTYIETLEELEDKLDEEDEEDEEKKGKNK